MPESGTPALTGPFAAFAAGLLPRSPSRDAITARTRAPEADCVRGLRTAATLPPQTLGDAQAIARRLVGRLRGKTSGGTVQGLVREYDLSSQEGVALMCLAEALLRIPDPDTRDALIRDKIGAATGGPMSATAPPCS